MSFLDYDDETMFSALSALVAERDPLPMHVTMQARASYRFASAWDTALAELVYDSETDEHDSRALVRGPAGARELTFEGPALTVEIEIGQDERSRQGQCRILGQLVPAQPAAIELRYPSGSLVVHTDALGRFTLEQAPTGPVSLRCTPVDGAPTDTQWTVI